MRGGGEMSSTCVQGGGLPQHPLGVAGLYQNMEPQSPAAPWQYHSIVPKPEPMDEERNNDSGISEFHSGSSPGSENSQDQQMAVRAEPMGAEYFAGGQLLTPPKGGDEVEDPLRRLQMALEKNGMMPSALSPKLSECSGEEDKSEDEYDEQGLRIPKVNSHGKVKTFKCKQCDFVAITKLDFWEHTKIHIKTDKLLTCPKCPFVTEYKHHLEYHLRNHFGSKPFKCTKCSYSCVNKSMLNSHLKSHSNIYQYRCADCSYATKYCHSLKLHLRKYSHKPAMVLNPDGTPNPLPIIDVYGTRRGPKVRSTSKSSDEEPPAQSPEVLPKFPFNPMQLPFPYPFFGGFPNPLFLQNLEKMARGGASSETSLLPEPVEELSQSNNSGALDLTKPEPSTAQAPSSDEESEEETYDTTTTMFSNVEVVQNTQSDNKDEFTCTYCSINFGDAVLYTMHMGYHGYKNPFTCNMCGEECKDKVAFFLHIARTPHS